MTPTWANMAYHGPNVPSTAGRCFDLTKGHDPKTKEYTFLDLVPCLLNLDTFHGPYCLIAFLLEMAILLLDLCTCFLDLASIE